MGPRLGRLNPSAVEATGGRVNETIDQLMDGKAWREQQEAEENARRAFLAVRQLT